MADPDGLSGPQRYWSIAVIWVGLVMAVLDTSIVNIALPTLARELNATAAESIWVINAYQLGTVMLLIPLAAFGEMIGYRRLYLVGMTLFSLASVICIFAPSLPILALGRGLQGIGAAGVMGMNTALVRHTYPKRLIGRALGGNAFLIGVATAAAPSAASLILAVANWRWLFAVNIPFCVFALAIGPLALPRVAPAVRSYDWLSAVLNALLFGSLVLGADLISRGQSAPQGAALMMASVLCAIFVVRRGWNEPAPLFPSDLLRIRLFRLSIATSTVSFGAQQIAAVAMPFVLQRSLGRSVVETGLLMTPWPIATALAAALAGVLSDRIPAAILNSVGLLSLSAGLFLLAFMPHGVDDVGVVWRTIMCGAGFGFFQSPNNRTMVLASPRARSGATGGTMATARVIGQSLGAVFVAIVFRGLPISEAGRWSLAAAGFLGVAGAVVSSVRLGVRRPNEAIHDETPAIIDAA